MIKSAKSFDVLLQSMVKSGAIREYEGKPRVFDKAFVKKKIKSVRSHMRNRVSLLLRSPEENKERKDLKEKKLVLIKEVEDSQEGQDDKEKKKNKINKEIAAEYKKLDKKYKKGPAGVATCQELIDLVEKSNFTCAVLGCTLQMNETEKFSYLTIDHIDPLFHSKNIKGSFDIQNLQPMCKVLNTVKGSFSDDCSGQLLLYTLKKLQIKKHFLIQL